MMSKQIDYVMKRANDILKRRTAELNREFGVKAVVLDRKETLAALRAGRFVINPTEDSSYYLSAYIRLTDEVKAGFKPGHDKAKAKLDAAFARLCDELVLGDESEALKLLRKFEAS